MTRVASFAVAMANQRPSVREGGVAESIELSVQLVELKIECRSLG